MLMPRRPISPSKVSNLLRTAAFALALSVPLASAWADQPSSLEEAASILSNEAQSLQSEVDYSNGVSYQAKQAVLDFSQTAQGLDQCFGGNGGVIIDMGDANQGGLGNGSFGNVPSNPACVSLIAPVIQSFQAVDYQLAGTDTSDPQVFEQYIRVRQALEDLRNLSSNGSTGNTGGIGFPLPGGGVGHPGGSSGTSINCIGAVCVGTTVQVVLGSYAGQIGRVIAIERNTQVLTVLSQRGQYIYPRYGEIRPVQQRDPGNGGLVRVDGYIDQNHFAFASGNRQQIYSQCMEFGARLRKSWVNRVIANGSTFSQSTTIGHACEFVMRMAR
ncbi:MAG: mitochondrial 54S ribosomal protein L40 [Methylotenera sp.]|nr:mitochondrial 54S ribosomal protein L40 [Oligoflexia bacterium]